MNEKNFYAALEKYYTKYAKTSMAVEVKITKTGRLPFTCLMQHQEDALLQAERTLAYKISDTGFAKKPFDMVILNRVIPVLVAVYYTERMISIYEIPIRNFIFERERSKWKSLSEDRAKAIATKQIII